jgi:hypothetical protein
MSEPRFGEIADEIADYLHGEARLNELADLFLAKMAEESPGVRHSVMLMRRRQFLFYKGRENLARMAPHEDLHRALMEGQYGVVAYGVLIAWISSLKLIPRRNRLSL